MTRILLLDSYVKIKIYRMSYYNCLPTPVPPFSSLGHFDCETCLPVVLMLLFMLVWDGGWIASLLISFLSSNLGQTLFSLRSSLVEQFDFGRVNEE